MSFSSSISPALPLIVLILASQCVIAFSDNNGCDIEFLKLKNQKNITMCKSLRTLGAQFAWSLRNGTNNSNFIVDVLFGAVLDPNETTGGWFAWGVNPGERAEMIGTKAIIGVLRADGSLKV